MSPRDMMRQWLDGAGLIADRVPLILGDPRGNPRETMVIALMAAIALITAVLFVIWAVNVIQVRRARGSFRLRRRPGARLRAAAVVGGVLVLAGIIVSLLPAVPATSRVCSACHAVRAAESAWRAGAHASVACYGCHAPGGPLGAVEATARGLGAVLKVGDRAGIDDSSCAGCHDAALAGVVESRGVRMRHSDVVGAGMSCLTCHEDVAHGVRPADSPETSAAAAPRAERAAVERSVMSRCLLCHDGEQAPAGCPVCHVAGRPSDAARASAPSGQTPASTTCEGCHSESVSRGCVECHGLVLPHPPEFGRQHAGLSAEDPALCASCHEGARPVRTDACACHTEVNAHGTYSEWFPAHGTAAAATGPGGCRCHDVQSCLRCHDRDPFR